MLKNVSLSSVRAFDAVARNGSVRDAALDLNLSSSAVSHSIQRLEHSLGVTLFERHGRSIKLSAEGEIFMRHVRQAFDLLRRGMESVSSRGTKLLRLHAAPTFGARWLSPRLQRFMKAFPDIELRMTASADYARFSNDDFDADIVYGPVRAEKRRRRPARRGNGHAIMSACIIEKRSRTPQDLLKLTLIQSERKDGALERLVRRKTGTRSRLRIAQASIAVSSPSQRRPTVAASCSNPRGLPNAKSQPDGSSRR
jgi:LysR family glycine cleavage system transcriptional activator